MDLIARGEKQAAEFDAAEREREGTWARNNFARVRFHFKLSFCNRGDDPQLEDWRPLGPQSRADSTFTVEGIRFRCRWVYQGGGDRAYWDDGWWPKWTVIVRRRPWWFPLIRRDREVKVWGPASIAEALR